ncbi:MAG: putative 2OG-Fe(II) oxygenase [Rhizomicrobium sp.]
MFCRALILLGEFRDAASHLRDAIAILPQSEELRLLLIDVLVAEGYLKRPAAGGGGTCDCARQSLRGTRAIEPVPGRLVLFPSYVSHATELTGIDGARISVAFDVVPIR